MTKKKGTKNIAAIVLAAGLSSRLGKPKQLLPYQGKTLIYDICKKLSKIDVQKTFCITGFERDKIEHAIAPFDIQSIYNRNYKTGMSGSIVLGIETLKQFPEISGALIVLSDQPLIPLDHYQKLINTFNHNENDIVATSYNQTFGVPAIFSKSIFGELTNLKNDRGAKTVIRTLKKQTIFITCPEAAYDIDTDDDYQKLFKKHVDKL